MITIRPFETGDAGAIRFVYKQAFAGAPWFEKLTDEQILERWQKSFQHFGFAALVALDREIIVGGHWRETTHIAEVAGKWGDKLGRFAFDFLERQSACPAHLMSAHPCGDIIWERHLSVAPSWQGRGIGSLLRHTFVEQLSQEAGNFLVLTRMRDDNIAAIRTAEKLGFARTGITMSSRSAPNTQHAFWFLFVRGQGAADQKMAAN